MYVLLNMCTDYAEQRSLLCFVLGDLEIPLVSQCRYLGITIDEKTLIRIYIHRQMRKIYYNANILLRRFSKCYIVVKYYLFKMYCSNLYCSSFWYDSSKTAMKKVKIAHNNSPTLESLKRNLKTFLFWERFSS